MPTESLNSIWNRLDRELWIVTATHGMDRGGLVATFVCQASIVPEMPRMLVGLSRQHLTWELVEQSRSFAMHLVSEEQVDWIWRFGLQSGRDADKFEGLNTGQGATGSPLLKDALAWIDCRVESQMETGDRTVYLAEILDGRLERDASSLTVGRMLELAPAEKKQTLKEQLARDAAIDARAIRNWRQE